MVHLATLCFAIQSAVRLAGFCNRHFVCRIACPCLFRVAAQLCQLRNAVYACVACLAMDELDIHAAHEEVSCDGTMAMPSACSRLSADLVLSLACTELQC